MSGDRLINCLCGNWEVLPIDAPRHHVHSFEHVENLENGEAYYKCTACSIEVTSQSKNSKEPSIQIESEEITITHRYAEIAGCLIQRTGWANYEGVTVSISGKDVLTPVTVELTHEQSEMLKAVL